MAYLPALILASWVGCASSEPGADSGDSQPDSDSDGFSLAEGDCDDADPLVSPGQDEDVGNDVHEDCAGTALIHPDQGMATFGQSTGAFDLSDGTRAWVVVFSDQTYSGGLCAWDSSVSGGERKVHTLTSCLLCMSCSWMRYFAGCAPASLCVRSPSSGAPCWRGPRPLSRRRCPPPTPEARF